MQFRVPQNITMEDRIIGSLTAIQFAILVIGGGISFLLLTSTTIPKPINYLTGGIMGLFTVFLAVGKFNGQPMHRFLKYIISFIITPKTRFWHKAGMADATLIRQAEHAQTDNQKRTTKTVRKTDIEQLAAVIDSRGKIGMVPQIHGEQPTKKG
jgi:PrgI family protein